MVFSYISSFFGILLIAYFHKNILNDTDLVLMIGSFGASAVLIYAAADSPLAQPRNLLLGHLFSALIGVVSFKLFSFDILLCSSFAVATSIFVMQLTKSLHPPGGATALIAAVGSEQIHALGFFYVLYPVLSGALILYFVAIGTQKINFVKRYLIRINKKDF